MLANSTESGSVTEIDKLDAVMLINQDVLSKWRQNLFLYIHMTDTNTVAVLQSES